MIISPGRSATLGVLAAAGIAALSTAAWSGSARPWDDIELWKWTVWLAVAAAVAGLLAAAGPVHLRLPAAAAGTALWGLAGATFLREWWLITHPRAWGWWTFADPNIQPITVRVESDRPTSSPSDHLTAVGYAGGVLLLVTLAASVVLLTVRAAGQVRGSRA